MNRDRLLLVGACLAAPFVLSLAFDARPFGVAPWYLSRAFGIAAFLMLSTATITGLLVSTKSPSSFPGRVLVFKAHQLSSVASVAVIALHVEVLLFDGLLKLSPLQLVVPFVAPYRHFLPSAGVISAWLTIAVTGSFLMRRQLGRKRWRALHYGSFGGYVLALVHGFAAGPDTSVTPMLWTYILSAASVATLLSYRIAAALRRDRRRVSLRDSAPHPSSAATAPGGVILAGDSLHQTDPATSAASPSRPGVWTYAFSAAAVLSLLAFQIAASAKQDHRKLERRRPRSQQMRGARASTRHDLGRVPHQSY